MKNLLLVLVLSVTSSSAIVEWIEVDYNKIIELAVYASPATIVRSGNRTERKCGFCMTIRWFRQMPESHIYRSEVNGDTTVKKLRNSPFMKLNCQKIWAKVR